MIVDAPSPSPQEVIDHEEVVLSRWQKMQQWFHIAKTGRAIILFIKVALFGTGSAVVVGEVTDTNPLRDAAIEIGLVEVVEPDIMEFIPEPEPEVQETEINYVTQQDLDEQLLVVDIMVDTLAKAEHEHPAVDTEHEHEAHKHGDHIHASHTHPEKEVEGLEATVLDLKSNFEATVKKYHP